MVSRANGERKRREARGESVSYHGLLGSLHVVRGDVLDLNVLARDWVAHGAPVLARLLLRRVDVVLGLAIAPVGLQLGVDLGIAVLLLPVQALDELLDVGDPVRARVVLPGWVHFLVGVHDGGFMHHGRSGE